MEKLHTPSHTLLCTYHFGTYVAGKRGQHGREIKLKDFEHKEGHIVLRMK
jgi:hypothetical protein